MNIVLYVILAIVILLLMIIIHEFGHYVAGKILKFKINEFSVGFGPKIISKKKKNGEIFSLRLIPLGGYCAFEGETDTENTTVTTDATAQQSKNQSTTDSSNADTLINNNTDNAQATTAIDTSLIKDGSISAANKGKSFIDEKPWKRIIVLLAGGVFNIISAVIFSFLVILIVGVAVPKIDVLYTSPQSQIPYNSQLKLGDEITAVNGNKIDMLHSFEDLTKGSKIGDKYNVTIMRDGKLQDITLTFQQIQYTDSNGKKDEYNGFGFSGRAYHNGNFGTALLYSVPYTAKVSWAILGSFADLVTGQIPITSLTGPVGTVGMMAKLSAYDWRNILFLLPLIASNLGIFNLLPIPALDGSKVVFTTIEWIRGKPVNRTVENWIHTIGLFALFAFVIIIDIVGMVLR